MLQADIGLLKKAIARIRHANGTVVGAGFLVSDSCLLTCAHVVTEALGLPQTTAEAPTALVELDFPLAPDSPSLKASIVFWSRINPGKRGEDIAGLKLEGERPGSVGAVQLVSSFWVKHPFRTFGFPKDHNSGVWASGELQDERADDGWVQMEAIKAQGYSVQPGFSGSPIWDEQVNAVVGMAVAAERKREEARSAFMIPTAILADAMEALSLIELLSPFYNTIQQPVRAAFNACCPMGWPDSMPATLPAVIAELQEMNQGDARFKPILQFVARLAMAAPEIQAVLKNWVVAQGQDWQELVQQVEPAPTTSSEMSYLFIKIDDTKPKSEEYLITALFAPDYTPGQRWTYRCRPIQVPPPPEGQSGFKLDDIPALLNELLNRGDEFKRLTIEFFLPLDLLNHAVDAWETKGLGISQMIGHEYQVIVRSVERLIPAYKRYKGFWREKWQTLQQIQQQQAVEAFVCGEGCDSKTLLTQLKAETKVGLHFTQPPEQEKLKGVFLALLQSGTPVGLWTRQNLSQCNSRAELENILESCVMELPQQINQTRLAACDCAPDAHIGYHLSFLWEDPDRVPEVLQYQMP